MTFEETWSYGEEKRIIFSNIVGNVQDLYGTRNMTSGVIIDKKSLTPTTVKVVEIDTKGNPDVIYEVATQSRLNVIMKIV